MTNGWFNHCQSLEEAKIEYRRLCFMYHPDHGGDHEVMQTINRAYASFKRNFKPRLASSHIATPATPPRWSNPVQPQPQPRRWTSTPPTPTADPTQRAPHPRSYVYGLWDQLPWRPLDQGRFVRRMGEHSATLVPYPPNNVEDTWVVFVDGEPTRYMFYSREEAERGAFEAIYEKVKYQPV